ncbi:GDP-mannose 4,6-dehydratase, partial [Dyella sp.]
MTEAGEARLRLLVTGAGGFVGEHVRQAVEAGEFGPYDWHPAPEGFDVRSRDAVDALIAEVKPDAVLHLAAQSFVPQSFKDPAGTFEVNVLGTLH